MYKRRARAIPKKHTCLQWAVWFQKKKKKTWLWQWSLVSTCKRAQPVNQCILGKCESRTVEGEAISQWWVYVSWSVASGWKMKKKKLRLLLFFFSPQCLIHLLLYKLLVKRMHETVADLKLTGFMFMVVYKQKSFICYCTYTSQNLTGTEQKKNSVPI